jgi:hypothetical protein
VTPQPKPADVPPNTIVLDLAGKTIQEVIVEGSRQSVAIPTGQSRARIFVSCDVEEKWPGGKSWSHDRPRVELGSAADPSKWPAACREIVEGNAALHRIDQEQAVAGRVGSREIPSGAARMQLSRRGAG